MSSPKKTSKLKTKRKRDEISRPVSFQQFRKLIENLPDIAFDVQSDQRKNNVGSAPDLERPRSTEVVTERAVPPVRFDFFKKYIKNLDAISDQMRSCDEYKHLSKKSVPGSTCSSTVR